MSIHVKVVNVVASTKLDRKLDLNRLSQILRGVQYEPEIFSGLVYRLHDPKATVIMFSTGKIVSVGTNSEETAKNSIRATIEEIEGALPENLTRIRIENVVVSVDLGRRIDLVDVMSRFDNVLYNPKKFAGLICKHNNVSMLIHHTGKVNLVGAKSEKHARRVIEMLVSRLS